MTNGPPLRYTKGAGVLYISYRDLRSSWGGRFRRCLWGEILDAGLWLVCKDFNLLVGLALVIYASFAIGQALFARVTAGAPLTPGTIPVAVLIGAAIALLVFVTTIPSPLKTDVCFGI